LLGLILSLSIQKSTIKIAPLPIQKSAAKNFFAADSEMSSDGGVISALVLSFFFLGVYNKSAMSSKKI